MNDLEESLRAIQFILEEHFDIGTPVLLVLGVEQPVALESARRIEECLRANGLMALVEYGSTPAFSEALLLIFERPARKHGSIVLKIPLAVLLMRALEAEGIHGILGAVADRR